LRKKQRDNQKLRKKSEENQEMRSKLGLLTLLSDGKGARRLGQEFLQRRRSSGWPLASGDRRDGGGQWRRRSSGGGVDTRGGPWNRGIEDEEKERNRESRRLKKKKRD